MIQSPKKNINHIDLVDNVSVGNVRRREILEIPVTKQAMLPKTVQYRDIDDSFKEWVKSLRMVTEDGEEYPTLTLFSNQRFSEYNQTWKHTDKNNNLLLNFKTVTRESNPQYGKINGGIWNIPGERFYRIKREKVLDENGTESLVDVSMRQPMAVDFIYKVSIFTNKYESINEFNTLINKAFSSRQKYLTPNGYYMPMVLDNISDESEYSIDDRQFYSQTYHVKLMGFILSEEDFRVSEIPLKRSAHFSMVKSDKKKVDVTIEDGGEDGTTDDITISATFPALVNTAEFVIDEDMFVTDYDYDNVVRKFRMFVNDNELEATKNIRLYENDRIKIIIRHRNVRKEATLTLIGYNAKGYKPLHDKLIAEEIDYTSPFDGVYKGK